MFSARDGEVVFVYQFCCCTSCAQRKENTSMLMIALHVVIVERKRAWTLKGLGLSGRFHQAEGHKFSLKCVGSNGVAVDVVV